MLQDFRDRRRSTLLHVGSIPSPAGGGSPALALAAELLLEAPELRPGQLGSRPMISSTTRLLPWLCTRTPRLYTRERVAATRPLQTPGTVPGKGLELNVAPSEPGEQ
jgi:hypothetical protein